MEQLQLKGYSESKRLIGSTGNIQKKYASCRNENEVNCADQLTTIIAGVIAP